MTHPNICVTVRDDSHIGVPEGTGPTTAENVRANTC